MVSHVIRKSNIDNPHFNLPSMYRGHANLLCTVFQHMLLAYVLLKLAQSLLQCATEHYAPGCFIHFSSSQKFIFCIVHRNISSPTVTLPDQFSQKSDRFCCVHRQLLFSKNGYHVTHGAHKNWGVQHAVLATWAVTFGLKFSALSQ